MKNLLYKELKLSIHPFHWFVPLVISALFLIPNWVFFVVLMYFFWISVPNIYGAYNSQNDLTFSFLMPVKKNDYVKAKIISLLLLELAYLVIGAVYATLNIVLYHTSNFMMDLNFAFFGIGFILYGLFNIMFFIKYFKTAYNYGLPTILGNVVAILFATGIELSVIFIPSVANILEGSSAASRLWQLVILFAGIIIFFLLNFIAYRVSIKKFERLDL